MSSIDVTKPEFGDPTTASVRNNFSIAANELDAKLPLAGGTVTGATTFTAGLTLTNLPTSVTGLEPGTLWNNNGALCVA